MRDPAWKDWYRSQHDRACRQHGEALEKYVTFALEMFHPDFINPTPAGRLGDGGADGLAEAGTILYAIYGQRSVQGAEKKLATKLVRDFERALDQWPNFTTWIFITNAAFGPLASRELVGLQVKHAAGTTRPLNLELWGPDQLWRKVVSQLSDSDLDLLLPGVPGAQNLELSDLVPLLEVLTQGNPPVDLGAELRPVPFGKLDFNNLDGPVLLEFNEGRLLAPRIERWFLGSSDPGLRDKASARFREIYEEHAKATSNPREILARIYTSVGGSDFRHDAKRANATYAVTAFFFDACDIFEEPPAGYEGKSIVASQ